MFLYCEFFNNVRQANICSKYIDLVIKTHNTKVNLTLAKLIYNLIIVIVCLSIVGYPIV